MAADLSYTLGLDGRGFAAGIKDAIAQLGNIGLAIDGVKKIASSLTLGIRLAADMESTSTAINTMLKDMTLTKAVVEDLAKFAETTPFELPGITQTARQLLGAGTQVSALKDELQVLGDLAAGSGADMGNLAFVLNQVRGAGKLLTQDFYQLTNAGVVGLREEFAKLKGIDISEVADAMSRGEISADDLWTVLKGLTSQGGKFYGAMIQQSKTWNGLLSTLSDNGSALLRTLSQPVMESLKPTLQGAIDSMAVAIRQAQIFASTLQLAAANDQIGEVLAAGIHYGLKSAWVGFVHTVIDSLPGIQDAMMNAVEFALNTAWNQTFGRITGMTFDPGPGFFAAFVDGLDDSLEEAAAKWEAAMQAGRLKLEADKQQAKQVMEEAGRAGGKAFAAEVKAPMEQAGESEGKRKSRYDADGRRADGRKQVSGYSRDKQGGADKARERAAARAEASAQRRDAAYQKAFPGLEGAAEFRGVERPRGLPFGVYGDGGDAMTGARPSRLRDTFAFPGLDAAFGARAGAAMSAPKTASPGAQDAAQSTLVEIRDELRRIRTE